VATTAAWAVASTGARCSLPHLPTVGAATGLDTAPGEPFPFHIVCPNCRAIADVADIGYRPTRHGYPETAGRPGRPVLAPGNRRDCRV